MVKKISSFVVNSGWAQTLMQKAIRLVRIHVLEMNSLVWQ
jgi:hypothetical protein